MSDGDEFVKLLTDYDAGAKSGLSAATIRNFYPAVVEQKIGKPVYKLVSVLHIAFKLVAVIIYFLSSLIGMSYSLTFVLVTILLSADFWFVKNISGRLMAGLRWWNGTQSGLENKSSFRFESWTQEERQLASKGQELFFWTTIIGQESIWIFLTTVAIFTMKLNWLVLALFAFILNSTNLYGFLRCKFSAKNDSPGFSGFGYFESGRKENMLQFVIAKLQRLLSKPERKGYSAAQL